MKRYLRLLLRGGALVCAVFAFAGVSSSLDGGLSLPSTAVAEAATNPYSGPCNCTHWAWQRRAELGDQMPGWGDAKTWATSARAAGYAVGATPQKLAVAVFQPGAAGAGSAGHVAVVEDAWQEGGLWKFRVSEANFGGCGPFTNRVVNLGAGMEFIYLPVQAPSNLTATATSSTSITFRWADNTSNESGFSVWRWGGSSWLNIANVGANTTFYNDTGRSPSTTYFYTVCVQAPTGGKCASGYTQATTQSVIAPAPTPAPTTVRFCEHNAAQGYGRCLEYGPGKYILTNFNDILTTIIIPSGYRWRVSVYEHANPSTNSCYGNGWIFTSNGSRWEINLYENNLNFNDKASCVVVERIS